MQMRLAVAPGFRGKRLDHRLVSIHDGVNPFIGFTPDDGGTIRKPVPVLHHTVAPTADLQFDLASALQRSSCIPRDYSQPTTAFLIRLQKHNQVMRWSGR